MFDITSCSTPRIGLKKAPCTRLCTRKLGDRGVTDERVLPAASPIRVSAEVPGSAHCPHLEEMTAVWQTM